jgi:hypothetical protein
MLNNTHKTILITGLLALGAYIAIAALTPLFTTITWREQGWYYVAWAFIIAFHLYSNRTHHPTK